ncbi:MAG: WYL domain-containing protein [Actinomycetota bacterium]|nr:WYL domain-containing protein [Actinomycetota bacterium]
MRAARHPSPTHEEKAIQRLERLINLVAALLETPRPLTADELRERVPGYAEERGAFRRAFERDKETLREMGVPVVTEMVDPADPGVSGYRIPKEEYYLDDPGLEPDELAALHLAASAVRVEGANGVEALWKLGGEVAEDGPVPAIAALPATTGLATLFTAISQRRQVQFLYRGKHRDFDPYRLSFRNGHWYVSGFDHGASDERSFRLDRFESEPDLASAPGAFERPIATSVQPPPWEAGQDAPVTARLRVDAEQAGWAVGHLGPESVVEQHADGSVVLAVRVTNREAFRSFVLGFLDHAEVLAPPDLRDELVAWLEDLTRT